MSSHDDADFQRYLLPPEPPAPEKYGLFKFLGDSVKAFFEFLSDAAEPIGITLGCLAALGLFAFLLNESFDNAAGNREKTKHRLEQQRLEQADQLQHQEDMLRDCVAADGTYVDSQSGFGGTCVVAGKAVAPPK